MYLNEKVKVRLSEVGRQKIAIGLYRFDETCEERIRDAIELSKKFADVTVVDEGEKTEKELLKLLKEGEVQGVVRGTSRASKFLEVLRKSYDPVRIAVLETSDNVLFLLAPVGVDEGKTILEKLRLIEFAKDLAKKIGLSGNVAVLAGGRYGDVGRSHDVDRSLADSELVAKLSGGMNYEILIEKAVNEGIVIAPDGISGNLIFRSLCYLGSGKEYGAPYYGVPYKIVDTSRNQTAEGFARAIALAAII